MALLAIHDEEFQLKTTNDIKEKFLTNFQNLDICAQPSKSQPRVWESEHQIIYKIKDDLKKKFDADENLEIDLNEYLYTFIIDRHEERFRANNEDLQKFIFDLKIEIQSRLWCKPFLYKKKQRFWILFL